MKFPGLLSFSLVTTACAVLLSACGGGDDKDPTASPVPPTATAEVTAEASRPPAVTVEASPTTEPDVTATDTSVQTPAENGTPVAVTVILTDYRISAFQKEFEVGKTYSFTIQNNGGVPHQFLIEPAGAVNQPLTAGDQTALVTGIAPGATVTLTWTFAEAGSYQFASHEANYYEQGMVQGPITVR